MVSPNGVSSSRVPPTISRHATRKSLAGLSAQLYRDPRELYYLRYSLMPDVVSTRLELEDGISVLRSMRTHSWVLARRVGPGGAGPPSPSLGP